MHSSALAFAQDDLAIPLRERKGPKNRSPEIDAMADWLGLPYGLPYCALGVSWCFHRFRKERGDKPPLGKFPYTASSQAVRVTFARMGLLSREPSAMLNWPGALFGWTNKDGIHGHVGFVAKRLTERIGGKLVVTGIGTIEYNTNLAGGRDGEGVYALVRRRLESGAWQVESAGGKLVGPARKLWFCNTATILGGQWWGV